MVLRFPSETSNSESTNYSAQKRERQRAGRFRPLMRTLPTGCFPAPICDRIVSERVCDAGAGLPILIQHLKIGGPARFTRAGVQAPGGEPQGRSLKALGGRPPR